MVRSIRFGFAALAATGMVGVAQAASLNDLIPNELGSEVLLSDENRERLINRVGDANTIDVGDSLYGILTFDQLKYTTPGNPPSPQFPLLHAAGNSELTGEFQILVTGKVQVAPGVYNFTFGADSAFDGGKGTVIRLWEDAVGGTTFLDALDDESKIGNFTDGTLYFGAGLASAGNAFVGTGGDTLTGLLPSSRLGDSVFALDLTEVGSFELADVLATLTNEAGSGQFVGDSNIGGPVRGSDWPLSSHTTAQFSTVPSPAAAGVGLGMLGMWIARRRRQA